MILIFSSSKYALHVSWSVKEIVFNPKFCASIKISAEYGANDVGDNSTYFNIDYFTTLYRSLGANEDVKIHFMKNKIIMAIKDEHYYRVGVLVGKNM